MPDVSRELAELGEMATPATIRQYEAGPREPGAVLMGALIRLFGSEPEEGPVPETDVDRLAKAIERLADVLERRGS